MSDIEVTDIPVKINEAFLSEYEFNGRYVVNYGTRRSGKSVWVSQALTRRANEYPIRKIAAFRKVARTLRLSVWPRILAAVEESVGLRYCNVNKTEMTVELPNGSSFLCIGTDDPEKMKSLEGVTDIWMEEATEFDEQDFDTIDSGLSANTDFPNQIWLTFNPIPRIPGQIHWLEKRFISRIKHSLGEIAIEDDVLVMRSTFLQNYFCPDKVKQVLFRYRETNPTLWKMWGLGEFVTLSGAILGNIQLINDVPSNLPFHGYGLDFGFADDPMAFVSIWKDKTHICLREEIYSSGLTNRQAALRFKEMKVSPFALIGADAAEPKSIKEIKDEGFRNIVAAPKGKDYKHFAAQWLQSFEAIYVVIGSTNLYREFTGWSWALDAKGNRLPQPADGDDHTVDATIYGAYRKMKRWFGI